MDLSRWGQKRLRQFKHTTRNLYETIGEILDGERALLGKGTGAEATGNVFEARSDVERLVGEQARLSGAKRVDSIFESLSSFYEAGFHLQLDPSGWRVRALFLYGRLFEPDERVAAPFAPPKVAARGVMRGRSDAVLRAFQLDAVTQLRDSQAFVFGVDERSVFVLLCDRAAPWLEDHVLRTRGALDAIASK